MSTRLDLESAITILDRKCKHWRLQCVNSSTGRRYECTGWAYGKRFSTSRKTPQHAAHAALVRVNEMGAGGLKIVKHAEQP